MTQADVIRGVVLLLTGLPGAGKTTLARALVDALRREYGCEVTLLDGDMTRRSFSSDLGYTREDRRLNVLRHADRASELCSEGGWVACALIAPYAADRGAMRWIVGQHARFIEIHVCTPLAVCETRDPKGLYARARAGTLLHLTGVDDPYEAPLQPELTIDTSVMEVEHAVTMLIDYLRSSGALDASVRQRTDLSLADA